MTQHNVVWTCGVSPSADAMPSTQHGRGRLVAAGAAVLVLLVAASSWPLPWQAAPPPAPSAVPVQLESAARVATQAEHQLRVYVHPLRVNNCSPPVIHPCTLGRRRIPASVLPGSLLAAW